MIHESIVRRTLAVAALVAIVVFEGCGSSQPPKAPTPQLVPTASPQTLADIAAFAKNPNEATWGVVHQDILAGQLTADAETAVIKALTETDKVPNRIMYAAAADLGAVDWTGTMKWVHLINVAASIDPNSSITVRETAKLTWIVLGLRASWSADPVDLTRADLRSDASFIGQGMNFNNVNFSQTQLNGGTWRRTLLTNSLFDGAKIIGTLQCTGCSWGNLVLPGTVTMTSGKWVLH